MAVIIDFKTRKIIVQDNDDALLAYQANVLVMDILGMTEEMVRFGKRRFDTLSPCEVLQFHFLFDQISKRCHTRELKELAIEHRTSLEKAIAINKIKESTL